MSKMEPRLALKALEAIADGSDGNLPRCPKCSAPCAVPLWLGDDPRHNGEGFDERHACALKCPACGEGWLGTRDEAEAAVVAWGVWNALHQVGWLS